MLSSHCVEYGNVECLSTRCF